jgi:hypothetical protein
MLRSTSADCHIYRWVNMRSCVTSDQRVGIITKYMGQIQYSAFVEISRWAKSHEYR